MFCHNCGALISDDSAFCPECGARQDPVVFQKPIKTTCPFCGEELEPDSVFCEYCGKSITGQPQSVEDVPHGIDAVAPSSVPPIPQNSKLPASQLVQPTAEPSHKKTKTTLVIGFALGIVLLAFVAVRYGDSIITLLRPNQGMPSDVDVKPTITVTVQPTSEPTSTPEVSPVPTPEVTPIQQNTPEPESGSGTETPSESTAPQKQDADTDAEIAHNYDPQHYETTVPATLADFEWVTYELYHGTLPKGIERLNDFKEISGGWKLYIIDEPSGEDDVTMDRLCRCRFGEDENGQVISINWDYVHDNATDEGYEENTPDSFFYGSWESGTFEGFGPGKVAVTDFWIKDGHEYAVGQLFWPDGIHASMFLVRP